MAKTYTLELTAEELEDLVDTCSSKSSAWPKLQELEDRLDLERAADELRLPWSAAHDRHEKVWWCQPTLLSGDLMNYSSPGMARLMSAAPQLLAAVKAAKTWGAGQDEGSRWGHEVRPLIYRALRKVETGVPEDG